MDSDTEYTGALDSIADSVPDDTVVGPMAPSGAGRNSPFSDETDVTTDVTPSNLQGNTRLKENEPLPRVPVPSAISGKRLPASGYPETPGTGTHVLLPCFIVLFRLASVYLLFLFLQIAASLAVRGLHMKMIAMKRLQQRRERR